MTARKVRLGNDAAGLDRSGSIRCFLRNFLLLLGLHLRLLFIHETVTAAELANGVFHQLHVRHQRVFEDKTPRGMLSGRREFKEWT
jgi:hypothetical protein